MYREPTHESIRESKKVQTKQAKEGGKISRVLYHVFV